MNNPKWTKKLEIRLREEELRAIRKRYGRAAADVARRLLMGHAAKVVHPATVEEKMAALRALAMLWADALIFFELAHTLLPDNAEFENAKDSFIFHFNHCVNLWCHDSSTPNAAE